MVRSCAVLAVLLGSVSLAQERGAADPQRQLALGISLHQQARYLDALQAFDAATHADDPALVVRARKGKVRAALRIAEFDIAAREAERLRREAPDDAEAATVHGDALWARGLFDEAERAYDDALSRAPNLSRALYGQARSLASRNQLVPALAPMLAALAAAPRDPDIHALAATIYERLNRFPESAAAYASYAGLVPRGETPAIETARDRATFLKGFGNRVPLQVVNGDGRQQAMPFTLVKNKIVVQGKVNGVNVDWVVDTGAERTGISTATAARAHLHAVTSTLIAGVGIARLQRVKLARADIVEVGPLRLRNVPVSVRDVPRGGDMRSRAETLSPLALGLSVVVDYDRRQLLLGAIDPGDDADTGSGASAPVRLPMRLLRLPLVRGVLNARHPAPFIVDTGGEVISISATTATELDMRPLRHIPLHVFGFSGKDESAFLLPGVDLEFDGLAYRKMGVAVLNLRAPSVLLGFHVGGILGHLFLRDHRVTFDLAKAELSLR